MKTASFAVLALLGLANGIKLESERTYYRLAQDGEKGNMYERHDQSNFAKGYMYPDTKPGRQWYELDNHHERLHGTVGSDDFSPYDPDVADAPEDSFRTGNDHQPLSNAKLSPDGYYTGYFHKDY